MHSLCLLSPSATVVLASLLHATEASCRSNCCAVITEDSDLVAYGCRRVLFKMDRWVEREAPAHCAAAGGGAMAAGFTSLTCSTPACLAC